MAARMVVLRRTSEDEGSVPAGLWVHVGAVNVDVDVPGDWDMDTLERAQSLAVEQKAAQGGVFTAIPFEFWRLFEAEARITVTPVPTAAAGDRGEPREDASIAEDEFPDEADPDLAGLTQGPRLP